MSNNFKVNLINKEIVGPTGPEGPAGIKGRAGRMGNQGDTGPPGPNPVVIQSGIPTGTPQIGTFSVDTTTGRLWVYTDTWHLIKYDP